MKTKSCKAKGRALQKHVAEALREAFPQFAVSDIKPSLVGESGIDIKLSSAARQRIPFGIECKNRENLQLWKAIDQCEKNAKVEGLRPLLVFKRNHSKIYAVLELDDLLEYLSEATLEART